MNVESILERTTIVKDIKEFLHHFETNKTNDLTKRGIYIYGYTGVGKSHLISNILEQLNYDAIQFDAGDVRNKSMVEMLNTHNLSDNSIIGIFKQIKKKIIIVIDEIDCMNTGDKGGINSLIKLLRPKKTKKQKTDYTTRIPIICIGNMYVDKKIKELMKCCLAIEIPKPTSKQMAAICKQMLPSESKCIRDSVCAYVDGDLKRLLNLANIININKVDTETLHILFEKKTTVEDTKKITKRIMNSNTPIDEHLTVMNEMDRTVVALLWHENIVDLLDKMPREDALCLYSTLLENICFADFIDRVTFQKQIWQFNEMSSLIKTFYTNHIFHQHNSMKIQDIRFTKVLTKYSTEYNNDVFIQNLCLQLNLDKKDLYTYITSLKQTHTDADILATFQNYDISALDINRLFRFLEF